ncbi:hypothetical protein AJ79_03680 [Helicocarpus griseus UAMH5409]|uniref:Uncharacterized protein n=1 Tax=Helicocarpus griseus UAMH5409 TaxID=1447875 RepID=A0A2B7XXA5_9EURO|nr:hypothetical protein AJ79_03680 [Helicocarpus griseus UAMH5409]
MNNYSPDHVRGTSMPSLDDWDNLPDRPVLNFVPNKFVLPRTETRGAGHNRQFEATALGSGFVEGVQFRLDDAEGDSLMEGYGNGLTFTQALEDQSGIVQETEEINPYEGHPFAQMFAYHAGFSTTKPPQAQTVDMSLIDPRLHEVSTGSPQPRRTRVTRSNEQPTVSATGDEINPVQNIFSNVADIENGGVSLPNATNTNAYPTPTSINTGTFQALPAQNFAYPKPTNTLLPPIELVDHQTVGQFKQVVHSHVSIQTNRFLTSIETMSMHTRDSMSLLQGQHKLAFTVYCHCLKFPQSVAMSMWHRYLSNLRFLYINIRDGLMISLRSMCWSFAEWMNIYSRTLPIETQQRAKNALHHAKNLKATMDVFVYPTWAEMAHKQLAREQPENVPSYTVNQLVGDFSV